VRSAKYLRILLSPSALSLPVLLLQIPLSIGLAFSSRIPRIHEHPGLTLGFAWLIFTSAALIFYASNWCLEHSTGFERHRGKVTLLTWLMTGLSSVAIAQVVHHLVGGGEQVPPQVLLVNVPMMWIASIYGATVVIESRRQYLEKFNALQGATKSLRQLEASVHQSLQLERNKLIDTVRARIKPELELISSEIASMQSSANTKDLLQISTQVDDYSLQTLRALIVELNETNTLNTTMRPELDLPESPKLAVSNLTLDPARSFRLALVVGVVLLLPLRGLGECLATMTRVAGVFLPIVLLNLVRQRSTIAKKFPEVFWVLTACLLVLVFMLILYSNWLQSPIASRQHFFPILGWIYIELSIILGAVSKYFSDAFSLASQKQEALNEQLIAEVQRSEYARQVFRRDVARILHGPIQGRLAAVRMKLHLIAERSPSTPASTNQSDIAQLTELLAQIASEIETFGADSGLPVDASLKDALHALAYKWQGMIDVVHEVPTQVARALDTEKGLKNRVVAACSEAVTNAARHGKATHIYLQLKLFDDASVVQLVAEDNGTGLCQKFIPGIGMQDIEADGGTWHIGPGEIGARLRVEFPLTRSPLLSTVG